MMWQPIGMILRPWTALRRWYWNWPLYVVVIWFCATVWAMVTLPSGACK